MNRREFILLLGAAGVCPLSAYGQQGLPVVGFLHAGSAAAAAPLSQAFLKGLQEAGFVPGENVLVEYRWAEDQVGRLPDLARDLAARRVSVIATGSPVAVSAAKAATTSVPIVFMVAGDPVRLGLVESLARPGGNLTGVNIYLFELAAKRMELLRSLVPGATKIALLISPAITAIAEATLRDAEGAARAMNLQLRVLKADTAGEIDAAFATFAAERPDALLVSSGPLFTGRRSQLAELAARHAVPAMYAERQNVEAGGLMSYGTNLKDAYRQVGIYAGRILKGAEPATLPVMQSTTFEMVINQRTARQLGLTVPPTLLSVADDVID